MIAEARSALPGLQAGLVPADDKSRIAILFSLADLTGKPDVLRNGEVKAQTVFWTAYHQILGHVPAAVLERAKLAYLALPNDKLGQKWFPDPGSLLALCKQDEEWNATLAATKGLKRIAESKPADQSFEACTPEEHADIQAKIAALVRRGSDNLIAPDAEHGRADLEHFKASAEARRARVARGRSLRHSAPQEPAAT